MKVSVIVPTYQERDNIEPLVRRIATALGGWDYEVIVVDDNSPDGTAEVAAGLAEKYPVRLIRREGVRGLGSAILEGFKNAEGNTLGVIDADLQHPPEIIPELLTAIQHGSDIAIASRYVRGGGIEGWSTVRRLISKVAVLVARPLTSVKDPMSGCFLLSRRVIDGISLTSKGYKILLEILVKGQYHHVAEVPYIFTERRSGRSKLGLRECLNYMTLLANLCLHRIVRRQVPGSKV